MIFRKTLKNISQHLIITVHVIYHQLSQHFNVTFWFVQFLKNLNCHYFEPSFPKQVPKYHLLIYREEANDFTVITFIQVTISKQLVIQN